MIAYDQEENVTIYESIIGEMLEPEYKYSLNPKKELYDYNFHYFLTIYIGIHFLFIIIQTHLRKWLPQQLKHLLSFTMCP
jgi:hypothetical protein